MDAVEEVAELEVEVGGAEDAEVVSDEIEVELSVDDEGGGEELEAGGVEEVLSGGGEEVLVALAEALLEYVQSFMLGFQITQLTLHWRDSRNRLKKCGHQMSRKTSDLGLGRLTG